MFSHFTVQWVPWRLVPRPFVLVKFWPAQFSLWWLSFKNVWSLWQMYPKVDCLSTTKLLIWSHENWDQLSNMSLCPIVILASPTLWHIVQRTFNTIDNSTPWMNWSNFTVKNSTPPRLFDQLNMEMMLLH
jgi:hypothetical protein